MRQHLIEKYLKGGYINPYDEKQYVEIFENPTEKEFREASGTTSWEKALDYNFAKDPHVRFFINPGKKKVYIWHPNMIHVDAAQALFGSRHGYTRFNASGVAAKRGGKWVMVSSDQFGPKEYEMFSNLVGDDETWFKKYIDTDYYYKR
jgi:hypothetical protein